MSAREFCRKFDALHISGGGNLTDTFLIELLRKCCLILTFAEQGKPVVLTGQQLGPFRSPVHKKVLSRTLREVRFVGLREPIDSLTFCRQAHLGPGNFDVMGDDSFGILPSDDSLVTDLLAQYSLKTNEFLAFNLRVSRAAKENVSHVQQVAELIDKTAKQFKMSILIVPISLNPWQSDTNSGKKLAQLVRSAHVLVLENNDLTPALAKGVLGKAFGAVGVSYHFCTFALSQGVPAVCIYDGSFYTQKARGLCGFWGDERLALPLKGIDADLAVGQITRVFEDRLLRQKIGLIAQQAVERWPKIFDRHVQGAFGELFD